MTEELKEVGVDLGRQPVGRVMRETGVIGERTRKFKAMTDRDHTFHSAPNLLDRDFTPDRRNQEWAGAVAQPVARVPELDCGQTVWQRGHQNGWRDIHSARKRASSDAREWTCR